MADAFSSRPESWDPDGPPRPPTFVQIRPPAAPGNARRKVGILGIGLALVMALGWGLYRVTDVREAPVVLQAAPVVTDAPAAQQVFGDFYPELVRRSVDTASSTPIWSRESLLERLSPFDPSVSDRRLSSTPPAETANATQAGSLELSVRLGKGDTIGSALQKLGFASDAIADVISALAPHVRLKRLPTGLGMTVQIRPSGEDGAKPILQALTLHPDGRREIKVERDDDGDYAVELRRPSPVR
jgi:hypothetical protein